MYRDNQDRIDAYLRGEMDNESRVQFERDLKSDEELAQVYRVTKAITNAIADRKEKLSMMARWDKEEEIKERLIRRRNSIRRWSIGMGAAACIAVVFFALLPLLLPPSASKSNFVPPTPGNDVYYRGDDSNIDVIDSLFYVEDYEQALMLVDSLLLDYDKESKLCEMKDSLTEKEEYRLEACKGGLDELNWRRANILIALGKTEEAKECLRDLVDSGGNYQEQADNLLQTLTE